VNDELKGGGSGLMCKNYPGICLEGLRKTKKTLSQDSRSPGRDLNPPPLFNADFPLVFAAYTVNTV
jgi:hypothetical protein